MNESLLSEIKSIGLSYPEYYDLTKKEIEASDPIGLSDDEIKQYEDKKLNLHRMARIEKHYSLSEELKNLILQIDKPQTWMIISETWCGDSAQNIPFIAKMAEINSNINLKIILRDAHPEIMNLYLTNGTRSVPILVALDEKESELFRWGPRPQEAKQLVDDLISQGVEKSIRAEKLHLWYGRNRGRSLEFEILKAIRNTLLSYSQCEFYHPKNVIFTN
jgi:hypothetical protein